MQPAFIRIIDHIRKQLDVSVWQGTYQDVLIWPANTTNEDKATVTQLVQQLEGATPEQEQQIKQAIAQLPVPHPGYHLCLQHQDLPPINVDLWELCYQVCFRNYIVTKDVEIDPSLIDQVGEVDWQRLDNKAKDVVGQVFNNLPSV